MYIIFTCSVLNKTYVVNQRSGLKYIFANMANQLAVHVTKAAERMEQELSHVPVVRDVTTLMVT